MQTHKKGFTLIELLVVIAIIGILSAIGLVSLGSAREKARNSRRQSDLSSVRTALALYYDDANAYPAGTASCALGAGTTCTWTVGFSGALVPNYIGSLPTPPNGGSGDQEVYGYVPSSTGDHYYLYTRLEGTVDTLATPYYYVNDRGVNKTTSDGLAPGSCGTLLTACPSND